MPDTTQKRKRPPTFQHFPEKRAKNLKKAWVETAKIKSKWKAQKRREGIVPPRPVLPPPSGEVDAQNVDEADEGDSASEISNHSVAGSLDASAIHRADSTSDNDSEEVEDENAAHSPPPLGSPPTRNNSTPKEKFNNRKRRLPHDKNNNTRDVTSNDDKPSLRELFQKAYSTSSLHTYKSNPFTRRGGHVHSGGREGSGASASRGRGQPNMKLRMNAMLEKIKRDYS